MDLYFQQVEEVFVCIEQMDLPQTQQCKHS